MGKGAGRGGETREAHSPMHTAQAAHRPELHAGYRGQAQGGQEESTHPTRGKKKGKNHPSPQRPHTTRSQKRKTEKRRDRMRARGREEERERARAQPQQFNAFGSVGEVKNKGKAESGHGIIMRPEKQQTNCKYSSFFTHLRSRVLRGVVGGCWLLAAGGCCCFFVAAAFPSSPLDGAAKKKKYGDLSRTRTCAGEPNRFLVYRLNHSAIKSD